MKTPEEIKKGLVCCSAEKCTWDNGCPYGASRKCGTELKGDALAYIQQLEEALDMAFESLRIVDKDASEREKQLEEQLPRWIPVEERMPEEGIKVLVRYTDDWVTIAFAHNAKWYNAGGEKSWLSVTHWMPLPKPPEEVK